MNNRLYNIEFGTFVTKPNEIMLSIPKQLFSLDSIEALNRAAAETKNHPAFLDIEKTDEDSTSYTFIYSVNFSEYKNLKTIHRETPAVRLSITKEIMEQDILNRYAGYVSIYPGNIWYHPMRTVKYAYRGNYDMPSTESESKLVRYKALLLYTLIGYPYEKALRREYRIDAKKNPFAVQIVNAENMEQLTRLIAHQEDAVLFENIKAQKSSGNKIKTVACAAAALLIVTNIINFVATRSSLSVAADASLQTQLEEVQGELSALQATQRIDAALLENDFEQAAVLMLEAGTDPTEIAALMYEKDQYNLALKYDHAILEQIVQSLYNRGEVDRVLYLTLDENSDTELLKKLSLEQAIASYNTAVIDAEWSFIEDKYTLLRAANAYVNNGNVFTAQDICTKLESLGYEGETSYINALISETNARTALEAAQKSLEEANALLEDDENRPNRITEAENNVNMCTESLATAEDSVQSTKTALYEAWANEIESS